VEVAVLTVWTVSVLVVVDAVTVDIDTPVTVMVGGASPKRGAVELARFCNSCRGKIPGANCPGCNLLRLEIGLRAVYMK
jgi:hypothetical protein